MGMTTRQMAETLCALTPPVCKIMQCPAVTQAINNHHHSNKYNHHLNQFNNKQLNKLINNHHHLIHLFIISMQIINNNFQMSLVLKQFSEATKDFQTPVEYYQKWEQIIEKITSENCNIKAIFGAVFGESYLAPLASCREKAEEKAAEEAAEATVEPPTSVKSSCKRFRL